MRRGCESEFINLKWPHAGVSLDAWPGVQVSVLSRLGNASSDFELGRLEAENCLSQLTNETCLLLRPPGER